MSILSVKVFKVIHLVLYENSSNSYSPRKSKLIQKPKEFDILYLLAIHPKKVYSLESILQQVWTNDYYDNSYSTVTVHIRTLRKKLGEDKRKNKLIKTIWGVGYTING